MTLSLKTLLACGGWMAITASVLTSAISLSACDLGATTPIPDGSTDDFDGGSLPDEGTGGETTTGGTTDAAIPLGAVRIAHMLKDGPAVDFCWRAATGGEFQGPVLAANGLTAGVTFGQVSARFPIATATARAAKAYEFRIITVGDAGTGCPAADAGANATFTVRASLAGGAALTLVAFGDASDPAVAPATTLSIPDVLAGSAGTISLRTLHVAPATPPVDVQVNGTTVLTALRYGSISQFPYTSANGFVSAPGPITEGTPLVVKAGTAVLGTFPLPELPAATVVTSFAIGRGTPGASTLEVIACDDNGTTTPLTTCARIASTTK